MKVGTKKRPLRFATPKPPALQTADELVDKALDKIRNADRGCAKLIGPLTKQAAPLIAEGRLLAKNSDSTSTAEHLMHKSMLTGVCIERRYHTGGGGENITTLHDFEFEYESNLMHNVFDKKSRGLRVNHTGSNPIFGKPHGTTYDFRSHFEKGTCSYFKTNVFDREDDPDNTRHMSVIFPLNSNAGTEGVRHEKFTGHLKEYLKPINEAGGTPSLIESINSKDSKFGWIHRPPLKYNSSDFSTELRRLKGTSGEIVINKGITVYRVQIHRSIIMTKLKGQQGNMVVCEEAIIQLQKQVIDNSTKQKEFKNTPDCLVLTARVKLADPNSDVGGPPNANKPKQGVSVVVEHKDNIHLLASHAFSMQIMDKHTPHAVVDRGDDTMRTFGWLLQQMSNITSDKAPNQLKAKKMFENLAIKYTPARTAASEEYIKSRMKYLNVTRTTYDERSKGPTASETHEKPPTNEELLKHSFVAHTKAFMIRPETQACNIQAGRRVAVQRVVVVDWTSSPSFGLVLVTVQGGKRPLNWVFIKSYSIQGNAEMDAIIRQNALRANRAKASEISDHDIKVRPVRSASAHSLSNPPVPSDPLPAGTPARPASASSTRSSFTPTPPVYDFAFNHLTGCSTLPEELELELELL